MIHQEIVQMKKREFTENSEIGTCWGSWSRRPEVIPPPNAQKKPACQGIIFFRKDTSDLRSNVRQAIEQNQPTLILWWITPSLQHLLVLGIDLSIFKVTKSLCLLCVDHSEKDGRLDVCDADLSLRGQFSCSKSACRVYVVIELTWSSVHIAGTVSNECIRRVSKPSCNRQDMIWHDMTKWWTMVMGHWESWPNSSARKTIVRLYTKLPRINNGLWGVCRAGC